MRRLRSAFSQYKNEWKITRKPKTKVIEKYEVLPPWLTQQPKDPFDYPLRSKGEVEGYMAAHPPDFKVRLTFSKHPTEDQTVYAYMDRAVGLEMSYKDLNFTPKQLERFQFLLGPRYVPGSKTFKFKVSNFASPEDNTTKALEILEELYMEAVRAP